MSEAVVPAIELGRFPSARAGVIGRLVERRWTFLTIFILVLACGAGLFTLLPTSYRATATVIVAVQESGTTETSAAWVEKLGDPADLESQLLLVSGYPHH
jgi:succinoglycan biosynthesis transport protein ExoP